MRKVRKPLPTSLRKAIITKNKNKSGNDGLTFIACSKAVKVYLRGQGILVMPTLTVMGFTSLHSYGNLSSSYLCLREVLSVVL